MAYTAHSDPEQVKERYDTEAELLSKVGQLAEMVQRSKHLVAFTGAGISTSAGIPDFRGPQGKWTREAQGKAPLRGVSTVTAFPTVTHMSLVSLQTHGKLKYLISQNCDGLHRRSGFPAEAISELHGNSNIEICEDCGSSYFRDIACHRQDQYRDHFTGRFCSRAGCKGALLEYTIDFGQNLPEAPLRLAEQHSRRADVHLVLGSSLTVSPACDLPRTTAQQNGKLVIVNLQRTPLDKLATLKIHAKTDTVMSLLMQKLGLAVPPFRLLRRVVAGRAKDGTTLLRAVDVHDPSLELSLVRKVEWQVNPSSKEANLAALSVKVHWSGHYQEPPVPLVLNLLQTPLQDIQLSYDPYTHQWTTLSVQGLHKPHELPARVRAQQKQGLSYAKAHREYCIDGVVKANPGSTRAACTERSDRQRKGVRDTQRARLAALAHTPTEKKGNEEKKGDSTASVTASEKDKQEKAYVQEEQEEEDRGGYVDPKRDCPHTAGDFNTEPFTFAVAHAVLNGGCETQGCGSKVENWMCGKCRVVGCSRYVKKHMLLHCDTSQHCIVTSLADLSTWCYKCDSYIVSDEVNKQHDMLYFAKFGEEMPRRRP